LLEMVKSSLLSLLAAIKFLAGIIKRPALRIATIRRTADRPFRQLRKYLADEFHQRARSSRRVCYRIAAVRPEGWK
jgi:hypothetical protein